MRVLKGFELTLTDIISYMNIPPHLKKNGGSCEVYQVYVGPDSSIGSMSALY